MVCNVDFLLRAKSSIFMVVSGLLLVLVGGVLLKLVSVLIFAVICYELYKAWSASDSPNKNLIASISTLIAAVGIASFVEIRDAKGVGIALLLIMVVCSNDIGAYIVGSNIKGPKLCPQISPNKTWSGFFGGVAASILVGSFIGTFLDGAFSFVSIIVLSLSATAGDLAESALKRYLGVKDLGTYIPGHGGVGDRLDSLIIASIVFKFFL